MHVKNPPLRPAQTPRPTAATATAAATATTGDAPRLLDDAARARVGLDAPRRDARDAAPRFSVRALQTAQVAARRSEPHDVHGVAATLVPAVVEQTAPFLGAGTFGAAYDLGAFVAKHVGDARSTMGAMRDVFPPDHFAQTATRQRAVHEALVAAGFPCVAAAQVYGAPEWLVMEKAAGVAYASLNDDEQAQARAACEALREDIKAPVNAALKALGYDFAGGDIDTDVHVDNARFARTDAGVVVAAFFDPIV